MNVLVIGLGRWGEKHLRVLRELGCKVWVADLSPARRAWAEKQGVPPTRVLSRYQDALPGVEAVAVVTPSDTHYSIVETRLEAGKPCFVEKPLSMTAAEGRQLVGVARSTGRLLQVGHILRFHGVTATLQEALADGRIGSVRYASGRFAGFKRPRTDVGVTHADAIHYFDLVAHLLKREAPSVLAFQRDYLGRARRSIGDDREFRRHPRHHRGELFRPRYSAGVHARGGARLPGRGLRGRGGHGARR
jgi:predicted dehydrogenase